MAKKTQPRANAKDAQRPLRTLADQSSDDLWIRPLRVGGAVGQRQTLRSVTEPWV